MNKRKVLIIILSWLMVLITCFIIVRFSLENKEKSTNSSNQIVNSIIKDENKISQENLENIQGFIRKLAHFGVYMLLGFSSTNAFITTFKLRLIFNQLLSCLFALSFSFFDEFVVQKISDGRAPLFTDVLIDYFGLSIGIVLFTLLIFSIKIYNKKRKSTK